MDISSTRPFAYSTPLVNKIAGGLGAYILLCLYPAYGLLRGWWSGDYSSFSGEGLLVAAATTIAFGVFARMTMLNYLTGEGRSARTPDR